MQSLDDSEIGLLPGLWKELAAHLLNRLRWCCSLHLIKCLLILFVSYVLIRSLPSDMSKAKAKYNLINR